MANFISLRVEPDGGTAFDYLINVGGVVNINVGDYGLYFTSGATEDFPLDIEGDTDGDTKNMEMFIQRLLLEAKQRGGNHYIVAAEKGPVTITDFS